MLIPESVLRSVVREAILKEQPGVPVILQVLVADIKSNPQKYLSSKRNKLETVTWKGKKYRALGFLEKGNPVALIKKSDLKPQDASTAGPFELLGQDKVTLTNAGDTKKHDLTKLRDGKTVIVSVRDNAKDVNVNIVKVDYDDDSIADIAIEVAGVLGAFPLVGEPVDIAAGIIATMKDPPDYLIGVISIMCAVPVLGTGVALLKPAIRKAGLEGAGKVIGEYIIKHSGELFSTFKGQVSELLGLIKKSAPEIIDKYDLASSVVARERLNVLEDHLDDIIESVNNYLKKRGTSLSELGPDFLTTVTKKRSFQDFNKGSKLVDEAGRPVPLFHGTVSPGDFATPSTSGPPKGSLGFVDPNTYLGAHFAQEAEVASDFAVGELGKAKAEFLPQVGREAGEGRTLAVFANVKNPIELSETEMHKLAYEKFAPDEIIEKMSREARTTPEDFLEKYKNNKKFRSDQNFKFASFQDPTSADIRKLMSKLGNDLKKDLKDQGYDAVKYFNKSETAGTGRKGVSWIIFEQEQMRPISDFVN
tara:strand:+ start:88 stop:1686 length:1599 start_codon:yes stop_codon:yes gene_type:complete